MFDRDKIERLDKCTKYFSMGGGVRVAVCRGGAVPVMIETVPDPEPAPDEVLIRIGFCGICGSDVSMTSGGRFDYPAGCHLGHEYSGEVIECGSAVHRLKVGDKVSCIPNGFCGRCRACGEGRLLSCTQGKPLVGGMGEYMAVPERSAIPLIGNLSLMDAALVEPVACARRAMRMAAFTPGDHVLVLGAATMGLAAIFWARRLGAGRIGVLSRSERGRDQALLFGADYYVCEEAEGADGLERLLARGDDDLPDIVIECGGQQGMVAKATQLVRSAGKVISMGMCARPEPLLPASCSFKEIQMFFPLGYHVADFEQTMRGFDDGQIDPCTMVNEIIGLEAIPAAIERLRHGATRGKILVDPCQ